MSPSPEQGTSPSPLQTRTRKCPAWEEEKQHMRKEGCILQIHAELQELQDLQTRGSQHLPQKPHMSPGRIRLGGGSQPPASTQLLLQGEHKDCCPDRRHGHSPCTSPSTPQTASHMQSLHTAKLCPKARSQLTAKSTGENNKTMILLWGWGVLLDRSHVCVVLKRALPQYYERAAAKICCDKETVDNSRYEIRFSKRTAAGPRVRVRHWAAPRG